MTLKKGYASFLACRRKFNEYQNILGISKSVICAQKNTEGNQGSKKFDCIKNADIIRACPRVIEDIKGRRETFCNF